MTTVQAKLSIDWRPEGRDLDYAVSDPTASAVNLRRVVTACEVVRAFLDELFKASGSASGYPAAPLEVTLDVDDSAQPHIVDERSVEVPVNTAFQAFSLTAAQYAAAHGDLMKILNDGGLRIDHMPPKDVSSPVQLRVPNATDLNLEDALLGRKYRIINGQLICIIEQAVFLVTPAFDQQLTFELADANLDGRVHLEAQIAFEI